MLSCMMLYLGLLCKDVVRDQSEGINLKFLLAWLRKNLESATNRWGKRVTMKDLMTVFRQLEVSSVP